MSNYKKRILVIGGGIGGLTLAIALRKLGVGVTVFERFYEYRPSGAGLTLWSNATWALKKLGLLEDILKKSKQIKATEIRSNGGKRLASMTLEDYETSTIGIGRYELLKILHNQIGNHDIRFNAKCIGIEQNDQKVSAFFEDGSKEEADCLIGADGIHSAIYENITDPQPLRFAGYRAWRGLTSFNHQFCKEGIMFEEWGRGLRFGFVPVSDQQLYWFATKNSPPNVDHTPVSKQELISLFAHFSEPVVSAIEQTNIENIIQGDVVDRKPSSHINHRVALIGDAAHPTTPNLGQGACQAIEDAVVLADLIHNQENLPFALKQYEALRSKRVRFIVNTSWNWGKMGQLENPLLCWLRDKTVQITPASIQQREWQKIIGYKI